MFFDEGGLWIGYVGSCFEEATDFGPEERVTFIFFEDVLGGTFKESYLEWLGVVFHFLFVSVDETFDMLDCKFVGVLH